MEKLREFVVPLRIQVSETWPVEFDTLIRGEELYGPFDKVDNIAIAFSPDSQRLAIPAQVGEEWFLFCGKEKLGPYDFPRGQFSADSKSLFCMFGRGNAGCVSLNGNVLMSDVAVRARGYSPDNRHALLVAEKDGRELLLFDGAPAEFPGSVMAISAARRGP